MDRPVEKRSGWSGRRGLFAALGLAAVIAGIFLLPSIRNWMRSETTVDASRIRVGKVIRGDLVRDVSVQGNVVAAFRPTLVSPARGVAKVNSKAGQVVDPADVLVTVASPELTSRLEQERSALSSLQADLARQRIQAKQKAAQARQDVGLLKVEVEAARRAMDRAERIRKEGLLNDVEYEGATDAIRIAELRLELAEQNAEFEVETLEFEVTDRASRVERQRLVAQELERQVDELAVRSPVAGLVSRVEINDGDSVSAGQPLVVVVDLSNFEVEVAIPEAYSDEMGPGTPAEIRYNGQDYSGAVKSISPEVEGSRVLAIVEFVEDPPAGLKQNQRVPTRLILDTKADTLKLPRGPFLEAGGGHMAYRLQDGLALLERIEVGAVSVSEVELLSGASEGDLFVISDTSRFDGAESILVRD